MIDLTNTCFGKVASLFSSSELVCVSEAAEIVDKENRKCKEESKYGDTLYHNLY